MSDSSNSSGLIAGIASGVGALAGGLGGLFSSRANRRLVRQQNDKLIQHQLDMWNMTNEYNTPLNQRMRLEAAGFNPNLMAGAPQNTAQNQNMPDVQAPLHDAASYTQAGQMIGETFQNVLNNEAQRTKIYADANKSDEQAKLTSEQEHQLRLNRGTNIALRQHQMDAQVLKNTYQDMLNANYPQVHATKMRESMQRILNLRTVMKKDDLQSQILAEELQLRKLGINPNKDGFWTRFLGQAVDPAVDYIKGKVNQGVPPMVRYKFK